MDIELFDYSLPEEQLAYYPAKQRDASKLLSLDRATGKIGHHKFSEIIDFLKPGDGLVINNTRVFKARLRAHRETGGRVEVFLLEEIKYDGKISWLVLTHPTRRIKEGEQLFVGEFDSVELVKKRPDGKSIIRFKSRSEAERIISRYGNVPLPIYIHREPEKDDEERYQTVYALTTKDKSVAAPTAGLHFTDKILEKIKEKGIKIIPVTLHVGYGTFKTVKCDQIENHTVDPEFAEITKSAAKAINRIKADGGKIVAVGTTSVRTLESAPVIDGEIQPFSDYVDLYIHPGYEFKVVDELITNFHLPKSSLIILVSAFAGREKILEAYKEAVEKKYRFYSYGDCMIIT